MKANIHKTKEYKSILDHLIENCPKGVYMGEMMDVLKLDYETANPIVHHLQSLEGVSLDYGVMKDRNIILKNNVIPYFLIWPISSKLVELKNNSWWNQFKREFSKPNTIISAISTIIAIVSLLFSLNIF